MRYYAYGRTHGNLCVSTRRFNVYTKVLGTNFRLSTASQVLHDRHAHTGPTNSVTEFYFIISCMCMIRSETDCDPSLNTDRGRVSLIAYKRKYPVEARVSGGIFAG